MDSPDYMYALGKSGKGNQLQTTFDFSEIPNVEYRKFLQNLPNFLYKKCFNVTFCLQQLLNEFHATPDPEIKAIISDSIYFHHPDSESIFNNLMKVFRVTIPKAKNLQALAFEGFSISKTELETLFQLIQGKNVKVENIHFKNCTFPENAFCTIIKDNEVIPYKFKNVSFVHCQLSKKSYKAIISFLRLNRNSHKRWTLKSLDFNNNDFTPEQYQDIDENYKRSNPDGTSSQIEAIDRDNFFVEEEASGSDVLRENEDIEKDLDQMKLVVEVLQTTPTNQEDPEEENKNLKNELQSLLTSLNAYQVDDDTFLISQDKENIDDFLAKIN